jgi:mono/diheme cytochrome c family protein
MKSRTRIGHLAVWVAMLITQLASSRTKTTPVQHAPAVASQQPNPYEGQQQARLAGAKLYQRECAACHGADAEGIGKALPLASREVRKASPGALFWVLRNGSIYRGMPSFSHLPDEQRWQIVTYLKSL